MHACTQVWWSAEFWFSRLGCIGARQHLLHHCPAHTRSNYGFIYNYFDRLARTYVSDRGLVWVEGERGDEAAGRFGGAGAARVRGGSPAR